MRVNRTKFEMAMMNKKVINSGYRKRVRSKHAENKNNSQLCNVRAKTLAKLAAALGVEPEDIIVNEDQR